MVPVVLVEVLPVAPVLLGAVVPLVPVGAPVVGVPVLPVVPDGGAASRYHWLFCSSKATSGAPLVKLAAKALAKFAAVGRPALGLVFEVHVVLAVEGPKQKEDASNATSASLPDTMSLPMPSPLILIAAPLPNLAVHSACCEGSS